jgi:hypothetical protein
MGENDVMRHSRARNAFILIELLVVIVIIATLSAILFPDFISARAVARTGTQNLKDWPDYDEDFPSPTAYFEIFSSRYAPHSVMDHLLINLLEEKERNIKNTKHFTPTDRRVLKPADLQRLRAPKLNPWRKYR